MLALGGRRGGAATTEDGVADDDLVQLLYTSGTTSQAKGAMMTHRALVHEYVSCIVALGPRADDVPLHPLPLYHSAQMHVFLMPSLAVGATNHLVEAPDVDDILERVPREGINALFLPPTVWVGVAEHPRPRRRDLGGLRKAFYGASIMPVPVLAAAAGAAARASASTTASASRRSGRWRPCCARRSTTQRPGLGRAARCSSSRPASSTRR